MRTNFSVSNERSERFELTREQLCVERERLAVEKERLEVERDIFQCLKKLSEGPVSKTGFLPRYVERVSQFFTVPIYSFLFFWKVCFTKTSRFLLTTVVHVTLKREDMVK